jgi:hypothetical protein
MFADPITITVNSVAKAMAKINQDQYGSEYFLREATVEWRLKIRNTSYTNAAGVLVDRHNFEFVSTVYATSTTPAIVRKIYSVFEANRSDTDAGVLQAFNGFVAFMTSANIQKALNYES